MSNNYEQKWKSAFLNSRAKMREASTITVFISTSTIRVYFGMIGMRNSERGNVFPTIDVERF